MTNDKGYNKNDINAALNSHNHTLKKKPATNE